MLKIILYLIDFLHFYSFIMEIKDAVMSFLNFF